MQALKVWPMPFARMFKYVFCLALLFVLKAYPASTSPELIRLEREMAPYILPAEKGAQVIPQLNLSDTTLLSFIEVLHTYGVEAVVAESIQERRLNIALRNLPLSRILQFVTQQVNVDYIYYEGRMIFFGSESDLNDDFKEMYKKKKALSQLIRVEERRLHAMDDAKWKQEFDRVIIQEFKVDDLPLKKILKSLDTSGAGQLEAEHGIQVLPMFNTREFNPSGSFDFKDKSLKYILDAVAEEFGLTWRISEGSRVFFSK